MISVSGKIFKNNQTGEIIKVIDSFEDIAILENRNKVSVKDLLDINKYTQEIDIKSFLDTNRSISNIVDDVKSINIIKSNYSDDNIDPNSFLDTSNAYINIIEGIKKIPIDNIIDEKPILANSVNFSKPIDDVPIIQVSEEDERAELAKKYGVSQNTKNDNSRKELLNNFLIDDMDNDDNINIFLNRETSVSIKDTDKMPVVNYNNDKQHNNNNMTNREDPIIEMFKNAKRKIEFNVSLEFSNKIPRIDFIELMEDSYDTSIIDFLADEFTKKILSNPKSLKENIKSKLIDLVYPEGISSEKEEENVFIDDSTIANDTEHKHDDEK